MCRSSADARFKRSSPDASVRASIEFNFLTFRCLGGGGACRACSTGKGGAPTLPEVILEETARGGREGERE